MRRRELLRTTGSVLIGATIAGCTEDPTDGADGPAETPNGTLIGKQSGTPTEKPTRSPTGSPMPDVAAVIEITEHEVTYPTDDFDPITIDGVTKNRCDCVVPSAVITAHYTWNDSEYERSTELETLEAGDSRAFSIELDNTGSPDGEYELTVTRSETDRGTSSAATSSDP